MAIVVIDAVGGIGVQDKRLINFLDGERKPFLIAVNKTDLVPQKDMLNLRKDIDEELRMCSHVPVLYMSAVKNKGVGRLLPQAEAIWPNARSASARASSTGPCARSWTSTSRRSSTVAGPSSIT